MAHFVVKQGVHKEGDTEHTPESGPFESENPLDKMFVNKFKKVTGDELKVHLASKKKKAKKKEEEPEEVDAAEPEAEEEPKARGSKKKAEPEEEAEEEGSVELGEDVTEEFDLAVKNDFKVYHSDSGGYSIKDGDNALNDKPLRTKTKVKKFLKEHLQVEDDTDAASGKNHA